MLLDLQVVILVVLAVAGAALSIYFTRQADRTAENLSAEDRQLFYARYHRLFERTDMPERFAALATAADRAKIARTGVTVVLAAALLLMLL